MENKMENDKMKIEELIFADFLPCNLRAFLSRAIEILDDNKTNNYESLNDEAKMRFRAVMWFIDSQIYGQTETIDLQGIWNELLRLFAESKNKQGVHDILKRSVFDI
jgi:hypothetical protein